MTKAHELRELTDEVLSDRLSEAKQELWKRRLDLATGQLDNTSEITKYKREYPGVHVDGIESWLYPITPPTG